MDATVFCVLLFSYNWCFVLGGVLSCFLCFVVVLAFCFFFFRKNLNLCGGEDQEGLGKGEEYDQNLFKAKNCLK